MNTRLRLHSAYGAGVDPGEREESMSEHGSLQFVWDIMLQSEWWKQYSQTVERSLAEQAGERSSGGGAGDARLQSGSRGGSYAGMLMSSGNGSGFAVGSGEWWSSSSGSWWMEIPEVWWGSFSESWWTSAEGSAGSGSGFALGYGLQLI